MRRQILLLSLTIIQPTLSALTPAFTNTQNSAKNLWSTSSAIATITTKTELPVKKKSKTGGGGFGGGFKKSSSSSKPSTSISDGKIRSVSGYTGSGTKALRAATNSFDTIVKECNGDKELEKTAISDVYVKSPLNDPMLLWFVGKVARRLGDDDNGLLQGSSAPTECEAVLSQKRLILEWAKNELRPQNLGGPGYSQNLEIWIAPGNSEMDSVQNKVSFTKVVGSIKDLSDGFSVGDVGFNPEIYVGDEKVKGGLRVQRDLDGKPIKPEFEIAS